MARAAYKFHLLVEAWTEVLRKMRRKYDILERCNYMINKLIVEQLYSRVFLALKALWMRHEQPKTKQRKLFFDLLATFGIICIRLLIKSVENRIYYLYRHRLQFSPPPLCEQRPMESPIAAIATSPDIK